jgi:hypothetical protein
VVDIYHKPHTPSYILARDGLGDISERHPDLDLTPDTLSSCHPCLEISSRSGVDVALDFIRDMPSRSITYLVLGPFTNLALMMRQDSETIINRIGRVVSMGGALDVPGNTSPVAECVLNLFSNIYNYTAVYQRSTHSQLLRGPLRGQGALDFPINAQRFTSGSFPHAPFRYHDTTSTSI